MIARISKLIFHSWTTRTIFVLLLCMTFAAWWISNKEIEALAENRFHARVMKIEYQIRERMRIHEQILRGGVGLFTASEKVSRAEWSAYVAGLKLSELYPGIQGMGWSVRVPAERLAHHEKTIRQEGYPDYAVRPDSPARDEYHSIIYLEPFEGRNLRAFGYDMYSESIRRIAMERARDSGSMALSGLVRLVQETDTDIQSGFLMYLPVYRNGAPVRTVEERRDAFIGMVYSPFRARDLMSGILGPGVPELGFEIFDGETIAAGNMLFDSHRQASDSEAPGHGKWIHSNTIVIGGQAWTIRYHSQSDYLSAGERLQPRLLAAAGLMANLFLVVVIGLRETLQQRAAAERDRKLSRVVEQSPTLVLITDRNGIIEYVNPYFTSVTGYTAEESVGRTPALVKSGETPRENYVDMWKVITAGNVWTGVLKNRKKSGEYFWARIIISPIRGNGEVTHFVGIEEDITALRQMEAQVIMTEKLSAMGRMASGVAHEINQPLNAIRNFCQGLLLNYEDGLPVSEARLKETLTRSIQQIDRMADIVKSMKAISIRDLDTTEIVDMNAISSSPFTLLSSLLRDHGITVVREPAPSPVTVLANATKLEQIMINLIMNAVDAVTEHHPKEGGRITVRTRQEERHGRIMAIVDIEDNGTGMDDALMKKIYEPFFTTKGPDVGTGLGLSLSYEIARAHGGSLSVRSAPGEGSTFTLELPFANPS